LIVARNLSAETLAAGAAELYAPTDPLGDAVQLMTIHKSKGLEFDTVILPGLHRATGGNDSSLLLWDEVAGADGHEHLLVAPMKQKGTGNGEASAYDYLKKLEAERAAHEDERLLYVAATRAIRKLHLIGIAVADDSMDDGLKPPAAGTLLKLLWPDIPPGDLLRGGVQPVFAAVLARFEPVTAPDTGVDPAAFSPPLVRLAEVTVPEALREIPGGPRPTNNPVDLDATESCLSLEASVGTLVHRCLELVAKNGLENWSTARVATLQPAWQRWLRAQGHSVAEAEGGAAEALAALSRTLDSATGRWLLATHPEAAAEQPWSSRDGNAAVNHVIDRIFVADGARWIIDYKTVRLPDDELAARAETYRPQLERYAGLFAGDPLPLRLAIFFPLQGILIELPGQ
jgi:ATP-dependent exoDNAse (exonuclease V) beta subunit